MTDANRVFVDTNILVYASHTASPFHVPARASLQELLDDGSQVWLSRQILREYLAVMTRPGFSDPPIPLSSVLDDIRRFERTFSIAEEDSSVTGKLLELLLEFSIKGKQVHDGNIVAGMLRNNIRTLLTHNRADFERFSSIIRLLPLHGF